MALPLSLRGRSYTFETMSAEPRAQADV